MTGFPILTTERLVLREFRPTDAAAVFLGMSQERVTQYTNVETMRTLDQAERLVAARASLFPRGLGVRWALALREREGIAIGSCGFYNLSPSNRSAEMGYDLHPDHWRRGLMTEALQAAIEYSYSEGFAFPLNRIEALTTLDNEASVRLLAKLGFQEEGVRRQCGYFKGAFHDLRCFSLLREDWLRRK